MKSFKNALKKINILKEENIKLEEEIKNIMTEEEKKKLYDISIEYSNTKSRNEVLKKQLGDLKETLSNLEGNESEVKI